MFEINAIIALLADIAPMYDGSEKELIIETFIDLWAKDIYIV